MLRARFEQSKDGSWQQRISNDVTGSYLYETHYVDVVAAIAPLAQRLEEGLDIVRGPVFRVALFNGNDYDQVVFLVAHHLVIDLVSWRIRLADLESLLIQRPLMPSSALPFQAWCSALRVHTESSPPPPPAKTISGTSDEKLGYWGLDLDQSTFELLDRTSFTLTADQTALLLGTSNDTILTETEDILLACLAFTFKQVFSDRNTPVIFTEGHGREGISTSIDPSETVGWFTTLKPCLIQPDLGMGIVSTLIQTKDSRRELAPNHLSHFSSVLKTTSKDNPVVVEILLNFLGQFQQLESNDSFFRPLQHDGNLSMDINKRAKRDSVFDIEASIGNRQLKVHFTYSKYIAHGPRIQEWVQRYHDCLAITLTKLQSCPPTRTVSDFPLLKFNHKTFSILRDSSLPAVGISDLENVEDIYPCSSIQKGMLFSHGPSTGLYQFQLICELKPRFDGEIDLQRVKEAWSKVVEHHTTLRSIIVDGSQSEHAFYQVVLQKITPEFRILEDSHQEDPAFTELSDISLKTRNPPHCLRICRTPKGRVFININMHHVFSDGTSLSILFEDLVLTYGDKLMMEKPLHRDYISFLDGTDSDADIDYWKAYLDNITPTHLIG